MKTPVDCGEIDHMVYRKSQFARWLTVMSTICLGAVACFYYTPYSLLTGLTGFQYGNHYMKITPSLPPPHPESIHIRELPLPPVSPNDNRGTCSSTINPRQTGCMSRGGTFQSGSFTSDGNHVTVTIEFTGAPSAPHPASMYSGEQVIIVKVNGTFSNGDSWKCITCGVSKKHRNITSQSFGYVQAFRDGKRLLAGSNIIECEHDLVSDHCTSNNTRIAPVVWESGNDGSMRELRLHPDQKHIAWSSFSFLLPNIGQYGYIGRLRYNEAHEDGPQYDVTNVWLLVDAKGRSSLSAENGEIKRDPEAIVIGEIRGFSGSGQEITYLGPPVESGNADVFAVNILTGKIRRLTSHPEYVDPVDISPDDHWTVVMDTRGSNRQMFISAMRGIPPLTDLITFAAICSVRNNGERRFFQPYLIDKHGDRGSYNGQKLNSEGSGVAGSGAINDPEWNGSADPKWSPDGNRIVYSQRLTVAPACGGKNPLPCYESTADGGRTGRVMLATLSDRKPYIPQPVKPFGDSVPWAIKYVPGMDLPPQHSIPPGRYILKGKASGHADVMVEELSIAVDYENYSDDNETFINGSERVSKKDGTIGLNLIDWQSNIVQSGTVKGTKRTSPGGFRLSIDVFKNHFEANGTLVTTIDRISYHQPADGT